MQILVQHCKYNHSSLPLNSFDSLHKTLAKTHSFCTPFHCHTAWNSILSKNFKVLRSTHFSLCSRSDVFDGEDLARENGELGLLDKPFPVPRDYDEEEPGLELGSDDEKVDEDEALAPFLKLFTANDEAGNETPPRGGEFGVSEERVVVLEEQKKLGVEYYEPRPGDFAVGVVVSGNENKLDVNVGADLLGTMLTKEVLPFYDKEIEYLLCDPSSSAEEFYVPGKMGVVVKSGDEAASAGPVSRRPVVGPGTVLFAEVLGRTLSGRPLLSSRRLFRRIAWHRVRYSD